jgi:hypothetical protein
MKYQHGPKKSLKRNKESNKISWLKYMPDSVEKEVTMEWVQRSENVWTMKLDDIVYYLVRVSPDKWSTTQFDPYHLLRYWKVNNGQNTKEIICFESFEYIKEHAPQIVMMHQLEE